MTFGADIIVRTPMHPGQGICTNSYLEIYVQLQAFNSFAMCSFFFLLQPACQSLSLAFRYEKKLADPAPVGGSLYFLLVQLLLMLWVLCCSASEISPERCCSERIISTTWMEWFRQAGKLAGNRAKTLLAENVGRQQMLFPYPLAWWEKFSYWVE